MSLRVSTLSHPKVAAKGELYPNFGGRGFKTQPPEGGCPTAFSSANQLIRFNTQPPEGGCESNVTPQDKPQGFNTQPPEGGCWGLCQKRSSPAKFQHSATRRWLPATHFCAIFFGGFQHSATRRWLPTKSGNTMTFTAVSTLSHPKVAA